METLQSTIFIEFDVNTKKITFLRGDNIVDYDSNTTNVYVRVKYKNLSGNTVYLTPSELEDYKFSLYTIKPATNNVNVITGEITDELKENVYGGVVKFEIPRVCTNRLGIVKCEIHINQGNKIIGSSIFVLDVQQSLVTAFDDELLGDEDFPILRQLILETQKVNNINDTTVSLVTTYSSNKIENIKENFSLQIKDIEDKKTDKSVTNNIQGQVNNLVLGAVGDGNNAEVVQARGNYSVLNDRFLNSENDINVMKDIYPNEFKNGTKIFTPTLENGGISADDGSDTTVAGRVRTDFLSIFDVFSVNINDEFVGERAYWIRVYDKSKSFLGNFVIYSDDTVGTSAIATTVDTFELKRVYEIYPSANYVRLVIRTDPDSTNITIPTIGINFKKYDIGSNLKLDDVFIKKGENNLNIKLEFEHAGLNKNDGNIQKSNVDDFYFTQRTKKFLEVASKSEYSVKFDSDKMYCFEYDNLFNFISCTEIISLVKYKFSANTKYVKFMSEYTEQTVYSKYTNAELNFRCSNNIPNFINNKRIDENEITFIYEVNGGDNNNYYSTGIIKLPPNYTQEGQPTRAIIWCHGSGDYMDKTSQVISRHYSQYIQYLVDEGYAVIDFWGWSTKFDIRAAQMATPTGMSCITQGYKWVVENYNIAKDGVFVFGKSLGGINAISLCSNKGVPVLACCGLAPEINPIHVAFGYNVDARRSVAIDFGFTNYDVLLEETVDTTSEAFKICVSENADKISGYNPLWTGLIDVPMSKLVNMSEWANGHDTVWDSAHRIFPIPIKIFIAEDDGACSYNVCNKFIKTIKNSNYIGELRTMPSGTGGHYSVDSDDKALKVESIVTRLGITHTNVPLAYVEMLQFFRRYEI